MPLVIHQLGASKHPVLHNLSMTFEKEVQPFSRESESKNEAPVFPITFDSVMLSSGDALLFIYFQTVSSIVLLFVLLPWSSFRRHQGKNIFIPLFETQEKGSDILNLAAVKSNKVHVIK